MLPVVSKEKTTSTGRPPVSKLSRMACEHNNSSKSLTLLLMFYVNSTFVLHVNNSLILHVGSTCMLYVNSSLTLHVNSTLILHANSTLILHVNSLIIHAWVCVCVCGVGVHACVCACASMCACVCACVHVCVVHESCSLMWLQRAKSNIYCTCLTWCKIVMCSHTCFLLSSSSSAFVVCNMSALAPKTKQH